MKRDSPLARLALMIAVILLLVMTTMLAADYRLRPPQSDTTSPTYH